MRMRVLYCHLRRESRISMESHIGVLSNLPRLKCNPAKIFSLYLDIYIVWRHSQICVTIILLSVWYVERCIYAKYFTQDKVREWVTNGVCLAREMRRLNWSLYVCIGLSYYSVCMLPAIAKFSLFLQSKYIVGKTKIFSLFRQNLLDVSRKKNLGCSWWIFRV
mgnify:CR=1 FL=1